MKSSALLFVVVFSLVTPSLPAQEPAAAAGIPGNDALVKEKGLFSETWMQPDADLSRYHTLDLQVAELQFREAAAKPLSVGRVDDESAYALSEEEQSKYRQVVSDAFAAELQQSESLQLVDEARPDTLIVRASILDITSYIPPPSAGRVETYPSAIGAGTVRFELIDAETGVIQARLEERSRILPPGRIMNEVSPFPVYRKTMWQPIERWSRRAAADLRRVLEKAQGGAGKS